MRYEEIRDLLQLIVSMDRSPFPDNAARGWYEVLADVDFDDARQAVVDHYGSFGSRYSRGDIRRIVPADVKGRAAAIREARSRERTRNAPRLPAGPTGVPAQSPRSRALLAEARRKAAEASARIHAAEKVAA